MKNEMLGVILAGGKGTRLGKLTHNQAKPAVPFGGRYRIIDFTLSNCVNSGVKKYRCYYPVSTLKSKCTYWKWC